MKQKFYSLKNILAKNAAYNMIIGERSNGKTYAVMKYGLEQYARHGEQMAIVRRWQDDFVGKRGSVLWDALVQNNEISKATRGEWTNVYYYASRWYLSRYDEDGNRVVDERPLAYGFSVSSMEHDKSTSYPGITTVLYDEFITRQSYIADEFVLFLNVVSTIVRRRTNVKIFMLGNTVNRYCPYFTEMGLKHMKDMKPGDIDLYTYGNSGLSVAVEYCEPNKRGKESDFYFAFDNPKLAMITGGAWELDIYPHCPCKYRPKDIVFTYFIEFNGDLLQCEIVAKDDMIFTFVHRKTTPIQDDTNDLIFTPEYNPRPNYIRRLNYPASKLHERIAWFYKNDKVFYQDNEVGEIVKNYLQYCDK